MLLPPTHNVGSFGHSNFLREYLLNVFKPQYKFTLLINCDELLLVTVDLQHVSCLVCFVFFSQSFSSLEVETKQDVI